MSRNRCNVFIVISCVVLFGIALRAQVTVWTNHNDSARTGDNASETQLTPATVGANTFGKVFSYPVDSSIYAQPLYLPNVVIPGKGVHNVIYVATMNDSVYAFDADSNAGPNASPLWSVNYTNPGAGITAVPSTVDNITGTIGILGTPVIDRTTSTMYFVTQTVEQGSVVQRLRAIDVTSGANKTGSPVTIAASVSGSGAGGTGGVITFQPWSQNQRPGLALANGKVYVMWVSYGDFGQYHGWVMAFDASTLQLAAVFNATPDGAQGGIWQSGQPLAIDASGNVYLTTGNGDWNGTTNFGESIIKLSPTLSLLDWFTPAEYAAMNQNDLDLGVSGPLLIPNSDVLVNGSKTGTLYVVKQSSLGHLHSGNTQIPQVLDALAGHVHGSPVYWNSPTRGPLVYVWSEQDYIKAFHFNGSTLDPTPVSQSAFPAPPGMPGGMLSVSGTSGVSGSAIVWASLPLSDNAEHADVQGVLRAFNADDLSHELWNSTLNSRDDTGKFPKYAPPTIANGKVYLGSFSKQLNVYGLLNTTPDFTMQVSPTAVAVSANGSVQASVSIGYLNNLTGATTFSVSGLPSGVSAAFAPTSVSASGSSTLTLTAGSAPQFGAFTLTVGGTNNAVSHSSPLTLSVVGPPPTGLTATAGSGQIGLGWSAPSGGPTIASYNVYRSLTSGFVPSSTSLIGQSQTTSFSDALVTGGTTYYYRVIAVDTGGNLSASSNEASAAALQTAGIAVDATVSADGAGNRTTAAFNTTVGGDVLVAFVAADGPSGGAQTSTVSGAGLTWTLVKRANSQAGTSEVWRATASAALNNATVTSTLGSAGFHQSLTVLAFKGASSTGASASASSASGATTLPLTTTQAGSLVYGAGNDWDHATARVVGANQAITHQFVDTAVGDTFWVQNWVGPIAGKSLAQLSDVSPTTDRWNFVSVEIVASALPVPVPDVVNQTQAAATTAITGAGLVVGTVSTASSTTVPSGSVISENPVAGTSVTPGSAVNLVVSTGNTISVPNVVNLTQTAATTAITNAGLVVGTITTASSTTVPSGSVISQAPASGASVAPGSAVNLVVSTGPPPAGISVDASVSSDGVGTRTATVSTTGPNRVLVAFAASDGLPTGGQALTVSGGGVTWTLVRRVNTRLGTSEIWQAIASSALSNANITATQSQANYRQSLTVVAFAGASGVGASNTANAASGAPTISLTTTKAGALVYGVGNDYDNAVARTVPSGQTKVHEWVDTTTGDTYWVQARTGAVATAGTAVTLNDTTPTADRWNFAIVEVVP